MNKHNCVLSIPPTLSEQLFHLQGGGGGGASEK